MKKLFALALVVACAPGADAPAAEPATEEVAGTPQIGCVPQRPNVEGRASPYDSVKFTVAGRTAQVCYGRPFTKGRDIFGGLYEYGSLWRTGANEPTIVHVPFAASIAGIPVEPGSYSLYTVIGESEWTVIVNRSISQWGAETQYTPEVEAQEVGRATVPASPTEEHVEQLTIAPDPEEGDASALVLAWDDTRIRIPVAAR